MGLPRIDLAKAQELTTRAEWTLLSDVAVKPLRRLSASDLRSRIALTRQSLQKWRDQSTRQRRSAQQARGTRAAGSVDRSREKAAIFEAALARFQYQLEQVREQGGAAADSAGKRTKSAKSAKPVKSARQERQSARAAVRALDKVGKTPVKKKATRKAKAEAKPAKAAAGQGAKQAAKTPKKKVAKKAAAKTSKVAALRQAAVKPAKAKKAPVAARAKRKSAGASSENVALSVAPRRQRAAKAAVKTGRIDEAGLTSRVRGHVSARGRRSQARRDSRKG